MEIWQYDLKKKKKTFSNLTLEKGTLKEMRQ